MLEFDEEKVLALIMQETGHLETLSKGIMRMLKKTDEKLHPYINAWINGKKPNFEFHGVSIEEVMKKLHQPYVETFGSMDLILEDPERWVTWYKTGDFRTR